MEKHASRKLLMEGQKVLVGLSGSLPLLGTKYEVPK